MTEAEKDIIGYLRGVFTVLILWRIEDFEFPLDSQIKNVITNYNNEFNEMLQCACKIAHAESLLDEYRSAIDDIVNTTDRPFYDQEWMNILLSLYAGKFEESREPLIFSFNDKVVFHNELVPVLERCIKALINLLAWSQVEHYSTYPNATPSSLQPYLSRFFEVLSGLIPSTAKVPNLEIFIEEFSKLLANNCK